jgi:phosphinothricin acetyltransferase
VILRTASAEDAAAVAAIWNHYIRDTLVTFNAVEKSVAEVTGLIAGRPAFFVALADGQVAGFSTYDQFRAGVGYARTVEHSIQLAPGAEGRGLGRALMTAVEDHARARGAHSMIAGVSGANPAGQAFHRRMGYCVTATLPEVGWKGGRWLDLVLMQKFLT